ncbi:unnamed protein product [Rhizophagus irregularis]|nr:unnamed protein product [Rhizophagus irregularis]
MMKPKLVGDETKIFGKKSLARYHYLQQYYNNANSKIISIINGALKFIKYFKEHWIGNIELGWTYYGRLIAANILNITVDSISNTNNKAPNFRFGSSFGSIFSSKFDSLLDAFRAKTFC